MFVSFAILSERNVSVYFCTRQVQLLVEMFLPKGSDALSSVCFQLTYFSVLRRHEQEKGLVVDFGCFLRFVLA